MSSWFTKFHCIGLLILLGSSAKINVAPAPSPAVANKHQILTSNLAPSGAVAVSSDMFLSSLGVNTHVDQGYRASSYVTPLRYLGIRDVRDGGRDTAGLIMLRQQTGARVDLVAGSDVSALIAEARTLAGVDALLAIEGANEPNNWPITYNGQKGGGKSSWIPVAQFQRDLYGAVKGDPVLKNYPVFHVSEGGAQTDNVGLQFLTISKGAGTLFPDGTQYADYANVHNYVSGTAGGYEDNQAWKAADPTLNSHWDGLYVEYGRTWRMGFRGYSDPELQDLQRVTTETGWDSIGPGKERIQGVVLVNTYLAQFKRGWRYTFIYELRDNEGGDSDQGLYRTDSTPKLSATYIHNLTSILAGNAPVARPGRLNYSIANQPATVHDLLLQKSSGIFELVIWGEQVTGANNLTVNLGGIHATVKIYDTISGTSPIQIFTDVSSVPLTVSDHAVILEIQ